MAFRSLTSTMTGKGDLVSWRRVAPWYLAFLLAFPLGLLIVEARPSEGPTTCLFRVLTHRDCPSCGLTRAFRAMGRLDVAGAFRYNPLGPVVFAGVCLYWLYAAAMVATRGRVSLPSWWVRWRWRLTWGALAVFLLVGTVRFVYEWHHPPPPPSAPDALLVWLYPFLPWRR